MTEIVAVASLELVCAAGEGFPGSRTAAVTSARSCRTTQYRQSSALQKDCGNRRQRLYRGIFGEPTFFYDACVGVG